METHKSRAEISPTSVGYMKCAKMATQRHLKSSDGKEILRKVAFDVLGSKVSKGIKQGFSAPDATWFRGQSVNFLNNLLVEKLTRKSECECCALDTNSRAQRELAFQ